MYLDILSGLSHISVNIKLMKILGRDAAIYFAQLSDIMTEVVRKKKFDEYGFFKLDRKYVEERTTLTLEEQYDCDTILQSIDLLRASDANPDIITINLEGMAQLLVNDNMESLQLRSVKSKIKTNKHESAAKKKAAIINNMKSIACSLASTDTIKTALENWVDAIYAGKRFLTKVAIETFVSKIYAVSPNEAVQLEVINSATVNGWTDAEWAINSYNRNKKQNPTTAKTLEVEQKVSAGVNKNISF